MRRLLRFTSVLIVATIGLTFVLGCAHTASAQALAATAPARVGAGTLTEFARRRAQAQANLPIIIRAAEAAAARHAAHPEGLVNMPYGLQPAFCEELVNRAGGLANALPPEERPKLLTPHDVLIASARSWQESEPQVRAMLRDWNTQGGLTVLFASKAGMPADVKVDFLIDNGAADGSASHGALNTMANILNGWLWTVEYAAALTRHGKHPGVLYSILMPGSTEHNKALQASGIARRALFDESKPIAAGKLAGEYLKVVQSVERGLASEQTQAATEKTCDILARHIGDGGRVHVGSFTHLLLNGPLLGSQSAFKHLQIVGGNAYPTQVKATDMVLIIGYVGMRTPYFDYAVPLRASGAKFVTSYVTDQKTPANNAPDALTHIEQHWQPPDAVVTAPFSPGCIGAISGINAGLISLMLEEGVGQRRSATRPAAVR